MTSDNYLSEATAINDRINGFTVEGSDTGTLHTDDFDLFVEVSRERGLGRVYWRADSDNAEGTRTFDSGNFEITSSMVLAEELSGIINYLAQEDCHV